MTQVKLVFWPGLCDPLQLLIVGHPAGHVDMILFSRGMSFNTGTVFRACDS
jgi:hypothetical protein